MAFDSVKHSSFALGCPVKITATYNKYKWNWRCIEALALHILAFLRNFLSNNLELTRHWSLQLTMYAIAICMLWINFALIPYPSVQNRFCYVMMKPLWQMPMSQLVDPLKKGVVLPCFYFQTYTNSIQVTDIWKSYSILVYTTVELLGRMQVSQFWIF